MYLLTLVFTFAFSFVHTQNPNLVHNFRPPAVPLIVTDPYTSYWSASDHLYDSPPQHWSGSDMGMVGMIKIDSNVYRYMGLDIDAASEVIYQTNVTVYPTQTVYVFERDGVRLTLTFSTPAMTEESEYVGVPVTFLSYMVECTDEKTHYVELYYDNTAEGTVSNDSHSVSWERMPLPPDEVGMRIGSSQQDYFSGGSDRVDWGYWCVTTPLTESLETGVGFSTAMRRAFQEDLRFPTYPISTTLPCKNDQEIPVLAVRWNLGMVSPLAPQSRYLRIFYDFDVAIKYFGTSMQPLWKHIYGNFTGALKALEYSKVIEACNIVDKAVVETLQKTGGPKYASLCSLAWRQATGGLQAVWNNVTNEVWVFLKEISSDGDVSTVDVLFPASPMYLWVDPEAMKRMLLPVLSYSNNETWMYGLNITYNKPWAPHHLGHWPVCDLTPDKQENMPIEESGNMLMMIAGVAHMQNGDVSFLKPYWDILKTWAMYILNSLPNPGDQLCTDDFEGPSPQNTNLAVKGVVGLASYLYLLQLNGQVNDQHYIDLYRSGEKFFTDYLMLLSNNGTDYKRQFNLQDSWSLKYNLLFQFILKLEIFNDSFLSEEMSFYEKQMKGYGIPLDDRHPYTKTDWLMWTAAMANGQFFQKIVDSVYKFADETPNRVPFTDIYDVETGMIPDRFHFRARPVIGGIFARLLTQNVPFPLKWF